MVWDSQAKSQEDPTSSKKRWAWWYVLIIPVTWEDQGSGQTEEKHETLREKQLKQKWLGK